MLLKALIGLGGRHRQQLIHPRLLCHRCDKAVVCQEQAIDAAFAEGIHHHLHGANEVSQLRLVSKLGRFGDNVHPHPLEKAQAFSPNDRYVDLDPFVTPLGHALEHLPEQVDVEPAAQTPIAGHHDKPDPFRIPALGIAMLVFKIGLSQMGHDVGHLLSIRPRLVHPLLRTAHFARRDHFHCLGDLLSILDTLDLGSDFLGA